jgi:hypothetical protein
VVELAGAAAADPRVELEGLRAVTLFAFLARTACLGDDVVEAGVIGIDALAGRHRRCLPRVCSNASIAASTSG